MAYKDVSSFTMKKRELRALVSDNPYYVNFRKAYQFLLKLYLVKVLNYRKIKKSVNN